MLKEGAGEAFRQKGEFSQRPPVCSAGGRSEGRNRIHEVEHLEFQQVDDNTLNVSPFPLHFP